MDTMKTDDLGGVARCRIPDHKDSEIGLVGEQAEHDANEEALQIVVPVVRLRQRVEVLPGLFVGWLLPVLSEGGGAGADLIPR